MKLGYIIALNKSLLLNSVESILFFTATKSANSNSQASNLTMYANHQKIIMFLFFSNTQESYVSLY
jgi:hypothetical protein